MCITIYLDIWFHHNMIPLQDDKLSFWIVAQPYYNDYVGLCVLLKHGYPTLYLNNLYLNTCKQTDHWSRSANVQFSLRRLCRHTVGSGCSLKLSRWRSTFDHGCLCLFVHFYVLIRCFDSCPLAKMWFLIFAAELTITKSATYLSCIWLWTDQQHASA